MIREFKEFLTQTNALALAVGVIIGGASTALVKAISTDFLTPIIGLLNPGSQALKDKEIVLKHDPSGKATEALLYGDFLNELINFVIIALVVFLITKLIIRPPAPPPTQECPFCKELISAEATRCKFCTSEVKTAA